MKHIPPPIFCKNTVFTTFFFTALVWVGFIGKPQSATAQTTGQLTGKITDGSSGEAMPFAAVTVWTKAGADSSLVGGTQTDEAGSFTIANLPLVPLVVRASFVGYQSTAKNATLSTSQPTVDMGTLTLKTDATLLREVKVVGEKEALAMSTEMRVFNVAKNLTSIGGTAESLLRNVPSITLDENGNPSLRNMATTICINGKPTQLTLAQIPANQIESIEVISNPPARYDASTSGGIVNLVLKKNRQPGYNGIASVSVGQNHRDAAGKRTGSGTRDIDPQNNFTNLGVSFDWKRSFARKKEELNLTTSLTRNRVSNAADWLTTSLDANGQSQPTYPETDRIDGRIIGNQYLAQLDYTRPVGDSAKWEFGLRTFTYARDQQYSFKQLGESGKDFTLLPDYS